MIRKLVIYALLILFVVISVLPIAWMILTALKDPMELSTNSNPLSFPKQFTFENLQEAWTQGKMGKYFSNSIIVAVPRVIAVLFLSSLAGFAFAKLKFPGRNFLFFFFLFGMMVPIQAMLIPLYYNIQNLGLINSYWALIIPFLGISMPFAIFMMRQFYMNIPDELMDAAKMDGCGEFKTYAYIMVPLMVPAFTAFVVFEFMWSWNEFLIPLLFVYDDAYRTLPLGLMYYQGKYTMDQSLIAAGVTISVLPIITVYLIFQRKFIEGITAGSIKG